MEKVKDLLMGVAIMAVFAVSMIEGRIKQIIQKRTEAVK